MGAGGITQFIELEHLHMNRHGRQTCNDCSKPDQAHCIFKEDEVDAVKPALQQMHLSMYHIVQAIGVRLCNVIVRDLYTVNLDHFSKQ